MVESMDGALGLWRERAETVEAVREGLEDVRSGRIRPADEVLDTLRKLQQK